MSGTCCWSLLRSSLVLGRGGDGGRWTNGLILFGSSLILFGSSLILFGSSLILFGSSPILFGSSLILFGSSSTFGTSKRGAEESGWKKCLKIWTCLKSKPVDWVSLLLPASYPSGIKKFQRILSLLYKKNLLVELPYFFLQALQLEKCFKEIWVWCKSQPPDSVSFRLRCHHFGQYWGGVGKEEQDESDLGNIAISIFVNICILVELTNTFSEKYSIR